MKPLTSVAISPPTTPPNNPSSKPMVNSLHAYQRSERVNEIDGLQRVQFLQAGRRFGVVLNIVAHAQRELGGNPTALPSAGSKVRRSRRAASAQQIGHTLRIYISAAHDHADALTGEPLAEGPRRGEGEAAGRFRHDLHPRCKKSHAVDQLLIRCRQYVGHVAPDDLEGQAAERLRLCAVRYGVRHRDVDDRALTE